MKLHPYLNFGGNCAEAFHFYEEHLGGKIIFTMTFAEMPTPENIPPGMENAIMYSAMELGETQLMGNDVPKEQYQPMRSAYLSLSVGSDAEAERIYSLLTDDGKAGEVFMPMQETFFATRFAMFRDRFGTSWMLLHQRPRPA